LLDKGAVPLLHKEPDLKDAYTLKKIKDNEELLRKLTTTGYFEHFSKVEKEAFMDCLRAMGCTEADIALQLRRFLFPYDKHSFVLDHFHQLVIDPVGVLSKMEGIHARRDY